MSDLKVGIVGLGWVAGAHIETFKAIRGASVNAICSRSARDPAELEARFGQPLRTHTSYEEMLASDVDVVSICTPHPFHREQAVAALEAGKHLILEKPIALSWEDARVVADAVERSGKKVCVCFECRFSAHFTMIRAVLDRELLGDLHYGEVDYYHGIGPWYGQYTWNVKKDFGGSSLLTAGCHALDALLWFMGEPVEEVTSYATRSSSDAFAEYEYPGTTVSMLKLAGGKAAKVTSSIDCHQPYYFHVHLVGSEGSLLDNRFYSRKLAGMTKQRWSTLETALIDSGDVSDHPYEPQFQAFIDAINGDLEMPLTDFTTALETHRVAFAADISVSEGRPVRLDELT